MLMVLMMVLLLLDISSVQAGRNQSSVNYLVPWRAQTVIVLIVMLLLMMLLLLKLMVVLLLLLLLFLDQPGVQQVLFRLVTRGSQLVAAASLDDCGQPGRVEFMSWIGVQINGSGFLVVNLCLMAANVPGVGVIFV